MKRLFSENLVQEVGCIGPYLVPGTESIVQQSLSPISELNPMITGNSPYDGGNLILSNQERLDILQRFSNAKHFIKKYMALEIIFMENSAIVFGSTMKTYLLQKKFQKLRER
jgi:hypothetical protein